MSGLFGSKNIAGTPDFQIPHGNLKTGSEFHKLPDRRQTLFLNLCQHLVFPVGQIRICFSGRPAYTASQLVKLCQSHAIRVFNDQRINIRYIDSSLDNRRT